MDLIPAEVLEKCILRLLDPGSKFNAAFACRHWFQLLLPHLPVLRHLNISLDFGACNAKIDYRTDLDSTAAVCQCEPHAAQQTMLIRELLAEFGDELRSIQIEDNLLNRCPEECVRDYPFHVILSQCNDHTLRRMSLHCMDLSSVRVWTLSTLARYSSLTSISFEECKFPEELSESLFLRMLAPSFGAIEMLRITNNSLITDKLGIQMAKRCVRLQELSLRGCKQVTAVSVVAFCEQLAISCQLGEHRPIPLCIDLRGTAFDSMELSRYLNSPLLHCDPSSWVVQPVSMEIGFQRKALLLAERGLLEAVAMTLFID